MIKCHYLPPEIQVFGISNQRLILQASFSDPDFGHFEDTPDGGSLSESNSWVD